MRYKVEFEIDVPDDVSEYDVFEWVRFELHDNGQMSGQNPLVDRELEPVFPSLVIRESP